MDNLLQQVNRYYKLNKVKKDIGKSRLFWWQKMSDSNPDFKEEEAIWNKANNFHRKRSSQQADIVGEMSDIFPFRDYNQVWNMMHRDCLKRIGNYSKCTDEVNGILANPPSGEEVAADPQMYVDYPVTFIRDAAKKLISGED